MFRIRGFFDPLDPGSGKSFSGSRIPNPYYNFWVKIIISLVNWLKKFSVPVQKLINI
jgi:hypothetical protein